MRCVKGILVGLLAALGLQAQPAVALPAIQHWSLDNGARVYFVPAPELPMVDVRVVFDAGAARDAEAPGLARLTNALIDQGSAQYSADAAAERLDGVGASLSTGAARDMAWFGLRSLSQPEYLVPALETAADLLQRPSFDQAALERVRQRMVAAVREGNQSPGSVADRAFMQALYAGHAYGTPPEGTEASLAALDGAAVRAFYERYYVGANAVVAVVGDLDRGQAERLVQRLVGGLPRGQAAPAPASVAEGAGGRIDQQHPSSQAHVLIGQRGVARDDPDYFALYLGNHVLGGSGLIARLATEVRERRGLSYSVYSYFLPMRSPGPFQIGLQTRGDQSEEAIEVVMRTLRDYLEHGPTEEEFEAARQNVLGGFPLRLDSNAKILDQLASIAFYGLALDYLETFPKRIAALTRDEVLDALRRRLDPERMLTVVVGGGRG